MFCGAKEAGGVYRPRHPQQSPFYRLVERFYAEFKAVYEERYQKRYGFWRPIIGSDAVPGMVGAIQTFGPKCGTTMRIVAFIERHQTEVIEKLRCAKRTSILGKLTGRAWEAHSAALWALGGEPGARPARGEGPDCGLRLRARRTCGAAASRVRRGIGSTVNYTREGRCPLRFQAR